MDSHRPSRVWTLVATVTWVCRSGLAGPAVPVGEGGRNKAADVDLPNASRPGPGEQGVLLDEPQSVLDGGLVGAFDGGCHGRFGDRPQSRHRFSPGRTSGHSQQPSAFVGASFLQSVQPVPGHPSAPGHAQRGRSHEPPRSALAPRSAAGTGVPTGRPAAVLIAAMRFATSSWNALTSPSSTLNGAPRRTTPGSRVQRGPVPPAGAAAAQPTDAGLQPNSARICSAVTGSPAASPSIPSDSDL